MVLPPVIRQLLAGLLLLVFSFSIAPKQLLHDALAHHKDKTQIKTGHGLPEFSHTGFTCKCDNLVAESPFTHESNHVQFAHWPVFAVKHGAALASCGSATLFFLELRGPPRA